MTVQHLPTACAVMISSYPQNQRKSSASVMSENTPWVMCIIYQCMKDQLLKSQRARIQQMHLQKLRGAKGRKAKVIPAGLHSVRLAAPLNLCCISQTSTVLDVTCVQWGLKASSNADPGEGDVHDDRLNLNACIYLQWSLCIGSISLCVAVQLWRNNWITSGSHLFSACENTQLSNNWLRVCVKSVPVKSSWGSCQ